MRVKQWLQEKELDQVERREQVASEEHWSLELWLRGYHMVGQGSRMC